MLLDQAAVKVVFVKRRQAKSIHLFSSWVKWAENATKLLLQSNIKRALFADHDFGGTGEISSPVITSVALTSFGQAEGAGRLVFISQCSFSIPPSPHPRVKKWKNIYHLWNIYWMKWISGDLWFFISQIWGLSSLCCLKKPSPSGLRGGHTVPRLRIRTGSLFALLWIQKGREQDRLRNNKWGRFVFN